MDFLSSAIRKPPHQYHSIGISLHTEIAAFYWFTALLQTVLNLFPVGVHFNLLLDQLDEDDFDDQDDEGDIVIEAGFAFDNENGLEDIEDIRQ